MCLEETTMTKQRSRNTMKNAPFSISPRGRLQERCGVALGTSGDARFGSSSSQADEARFYISPSDSLEPGGRRRGVKVRGAPAAGARSLGRTRATSGSAGEVDDRGRVGRSGLGDEIAERKGEIDDRRRVGQSGAWLAGEVVIAQHEME